MDGFILYIVQIISAGIGALGFSLIFNLQKRNLLPATFGGMVSWALYLICFESGMGFFISAVITSAFCQIYSECFARFLKSPATVFYIPAIIPLVPGGALYYTMYYATKNEWSSFRSYGWQTLQISLGIAIGASFVSAILLLIPKKNAK